MPSMRTDTFEAAAGALDANWTQQRTAGTVNYNGSGSAVASVNDKDLFAFDNLNSYPDDQYSKITIGSVSNFDSYAQVLTRCGQTGDAAYDNYFGTSDGVTGATHSEFGEAVNGVVTVLRNFTMTLTGGDIFELRSIGTLHECFKNGVSVGTHTDASHASGSAGLGLFDAAAGGVCSITFWEGGNLSALPSLPAPPGRGFAPQQMVG